MPFLLISYLAFFLIVFFTRFFQFHNYGFGYFNLGLYSQVVFNIIEGYLNPLLPTLGQRFLDIKLQPIFYLFLPFKLSGFRPELFFIIDIIFVGVATLALARFAERMFHNHLLTFCVGFMYLFSVQTFKYLVQPVNVVLWAQAFVVLALTEFALQRRVKQLALWNFLLCLVDLHFFVFGLALGIVNIFTKAHRWNLSRRAFVSSFLIGVSLLAFAGVKMAGSPVFTYTVYKQTFIFPILILAALYFVNWISFGQEVALNLFSAILILATLAWQWKSADPFFGFWKLSKYQMSQASHLNESLVNSVPFNSNVMVSDRFSPHLAFMPTMLTERNRTRVNTIEWALLERVPEWFNLSQFEVVDQNSQTGARLLRRIK